MLMIQVIATSLDRPGAAIPGAWRPALPMAGCLAVTQGDDHDLGMGSGLAGDPETSRDFEALRFDADLKAHGAPNSAETLSTMASMP